MNKVIAVIPAYNEGNVIADVVRSLNGVVDEIIVVDDGSGDASGKLARDAGARVLRHRINRGQGAALQTGTEAALRRGADIVVHFDADGQHDVGDIARLIEPLQSNRADVVLGSRFLGQARNIPTTRRLVLRAGRLFMRLFSGLSLTDAQNGLRAMTREAARAISITQDGMAHASEILDRIGELGLRYLEVPVTIHYTEYSLSRGQRSSNAIRIVWRLITDKFF